MAKLYFRYGAMNCGKTTALLQVNYNYKEKGMKAIILKPSVDKKGGSSVVTRIGIEKKVDYLIKETDDIIKVIDLNKVDCILVDEAQFLSRNQIEQLWVISKKKNIPVICYGLRVDFQTNMFPGSSRLFELADEIEELITICRCGKRAKLNVRKLNNKYVFDGDQISIDGIDSTYESLCGKCYLEEKEKANKITNKNHIK